MLYLWTFHRRGVLVAGGLLFALLFLLATTALVARALQPSTHPRSAAILPAPSATTQPSATAGDVSYWDAMAPVAPATTAGLPPISLYAASDPSAYARAFAIELFTRDYRRISRAQLIAWAQYEDAPLRSPNYPTADWSKVLVDSLDDLTWDTATDTPIPAPGTWLALRSERATDTVSAVQVSTDPTWEQQIASGYQPPDPMTTVREVSLTVTERTLVGRHVTVHHNAVSLQVQLGSSPRHAGYAAAVTNNYVNAAVD